MDNTEILKKLFDEKIISVLNVFFDYSDENLSLTQICSLSKVNPATTIRIINKLLEQDILDLIKSGKSKSYKIKQTPKTLFLTKLLNKEDHLSELIDKIILLPYLEKIVLESKGKTNLKFLFVVSSEGKDNIQRITKEFQLKYDIKIQFIEVSESQFNDLDRFGAYNLSNKVIWERKK